MTDSIQKWKKIGWFDGNYIFPYVLNFSYAFLVVSICTKINKKKFVSNSKNITNGLFEALALLVLQNTNSWQFFSLEKNFICFSRNLYRKKTIFLLLIGRFWKDLNQCDLWIVFIRRFKILFNKFRMSFFICFNQTIAILL